MKLQRKIKRHMQRALAGATLAAMLFTAPALAMPTGWSVIEGQGNITVQDPTGNVMNINVGANGVIDWSSFSIAAGETVNFDFAAMHAVLNRVTGNQMSELHGTLSSSGAAGSVLLVNPNGVLVGSGATINTSNLVLSTLDISNDNFMQVVGAWTVDEEHPLTFTKNSQQTVAGGIEIKSGAVFQPMGYLGLIGGSITIAPNVTIETSMDSSFVAADRATICYMQQPNGAIEHYDTVSFNTQAANSVLMQGNITSDTINIHGYKITLDQAELTANWLDVFAANTFESQSTNYDDLYIRTLTATPDNKITLTDSTITLTDGYFEEEYVTTLLGGQVDMEDSSIVVGEQLTLDSSKVIIAAANTLQWQFGGRDLDDDDYAFAGIDIHAATPNNAIALNNVSIATETPHEDTANILILGGKVDITGDSQLKGNEIFIGAGSQLGLKAAYDEDNDVYYGEYYFTNSFKSGLGNTVTLGQGAELVANGESAIYANAITNAGTIKVHGHFGLGLVAADELNFDPEENTGYAVISQSNQVINSGTISVDQANFKNDGNTDPAGSVLTIIAGSIDNTGGMIETSRLDGSDIVPAKLLVIGTVQGIDPADASIQVTEENKDLENYKYKVSLDALGAIQNIEELPISDGPTNSDIDDILNGAGSLAEKEQQIVEVINNINSLTGEEQTAAVENALRSIQESALSPAEQITLLNSVVNTFEGTAAARAEANNQRTANQTQSVNTEAPADTADFSGDDNSPVLIESV